MAGVVVLLMIWLTAFVKDTMSPESTNMMTDLVEKRLNSSSYNSRIRPGADKDALKVYINMEVADISSISEINMEYSMSLFLRQIWTDDRLVFTEFTRDITLNYNQLDRIWAPDLFVRNLKTGLFHTITVPNRLIRLSPDGTIFFSQRLTLTLSCDMQLDRYPMDNQTCTIQYGSYGYTTDDIVFLWRLDAPAVELDDGINLPEYTLTNVTSSVCVHSGIGQKPCIVANFHLTRRIKAYILSTYIPQLLVVVVSWLSFYMDPASAPARTSLSITTVLTMITTQSYGQGRAMPSGSIPKAIDVWMVTCLVFVFAAFVEFSIVNTLVRKKKETKTTTSSTSLSDTSAGAQSDSDIKKKVCSRMHRFVDRIKDDPADAVEKTSRVLFPLTFLIFNLIYWPYYTLS